MKNFRNPGAAMRSGRSGSRASVVAAPSSGSEDSEWEEERVARLRERAWRDGPRGPGSGGKGRSRRSREQRTNWRVPAGHERKITAKIRASLAKRRLQQPFPFTWLGNSGSQSPNLSNLLSCETLIQFFLLHMSSNQS
uniref:Uncharacterized protein n=1 Tax=Laticauda laticaudata TaxID=8630 RepID=A0A8C5RDH6_LATLA